MLATAARGRSGLRQSQRRVCVCVFFCIAFFACQATRLMCDVHRSPSCRTVSAPVNTGSTRAFLAQGAYNRNLCRSLPTPLCVHAPSGFTPHLVALPRSGVQIAISLFSCAPASSAPPTRAAHSFPSSKKFPGPSTWRTIPVAPVV